MLCKGCIVKVNVASVGHKKNNRDALKTHKSDPQRDTVNWNYCIKHQISKNTNNTRNNTSLKSTAFNSCTTLVELNYSWIYQDYYNRGWISWLYINFKCFTYFYVLNALFVEIVQIHLYILKETKTNILRESSAFLSLDKWANIHNLPFLHKVKPNFDNIFKCLLMVNSYHGLKANRFSWVLNQCVLSHYVQGFYYRGNSFQYNADRWREIKAYKMVTLLNTQSSRRQCKDIAGTSSWISVLRYASTSQQAAHSSHCSQCSVRSYCSQGREFLPHSPVHFLFSSPRPFE